MAILSKKLQKLSSFWGLRPYTSSATRLVGLVSSVSHLIIQTFFEQTIFSLYGPSLPLPPLRKVLVARLLQIVNLLIKFYSKDCYEYKQKKNWPFQNYNCVH